jgi:hypothetical protein
MNLDALLRIKADVQGENNIRRLGNSMQGLQGQAKNAALGFSNLKSAVAGFGAAIAGSAIVGGLSAIVKKSIDAGDELFNLQAKTGVAANALIGIGNAAKLADVDMATLGKGLTKLNINLVRAAEGNDDLARKFQALGVNVKDANGQVVPADQALKQIADRFADMPDGAQKAAAAVALFGKAGADLIPLLNEGAAAMDEFTYKVSDDFAARSDLFNDTIAELGIKTQGFGLELTDALLPALQSILEVFGELFDTKQDWTALFDVIKVGVRSLATVLLAMVKLVDEAVRVIGSFAKRAQLVFAGDFAGARAEADRFGSDFMQRFQTSVDQFQRLWTDSASPGTGMRRGGRNMALDTSAADRERDAAARKAAAEAKRAASEQERLEQRRYDLGQQALDLQEDLRRKIEDVNAAYAGVGLTPTQDLQQQRNDAITENSRQVDDLTRKVIELVRDVNAAGGEIDVKPFEQLINTLSAGNVTLADKAFTQGLIDLLPALQEYDDKIAEVVRGKVQLTELEKLNAQISQLQLDILAQTNPALAQQIALLRERAGALDAATKKQEESAKSFGTQFRDSFKQAYDSATNLGANLASIASNGIDGLTNAIVEFASTGKAAFKEFAASVLKDLGAMLIKFSIFKAVGAIFPGLNLGGAFANGGVMTASGPAPLKRYSQGGIANRPQLALYGEGSKPEAYVPLPDGRRIPVALQGQDKMREVMGAGPAQGATTPVLNMSFQSTNIGGVEYVSRDQLEAAMAETRRAASRDGARRGMSMTLDKLQQSPSTRTRVGLR